MMIIVTSVKMPFTEEDKNSGVVCRRLSACVQAGGEHFEHYF